jgi:hypothetical protein
LAGALAAYEKSRASVEKEIENDAANTLALRDLAIAYRNVAFVHQDFLKITTGENRRNHFAAARENYRRALDILLKAETQNALPEADRAVLEQVRAAVEQFGAAEN